MADTCSFAAEVASLGETRLRDVLVGWFSPALEELVL